MHGRLLIEKLVAEDGHILGAPLTPLGYGRAWRSAKADVRMCLAD
jgi:hypothetical protein